MSSLRGIWGRARPRSRRALLIVAAVGMAVFVWLSLSLLAAYFLTRRGETRRPELIPTITGYQVEDHRLRTVDGQEIGAWFVEAAPDRPTVVLVHGNGGRRGSCWSRAILLLKEGYSVLLISCRAHGDSSGNYNDFGWGARHDVIAAVDWLRQRRPGQPIVLWGASLGSAAVVFAAAELETGVDALILECPYRDLSTAVWNRFENQFPPVIDAIGYAGMRIGALMYVPHLRQISPVNSIDTIPEQVRVLILAGQDDTRARPAEAIALHERIKSHSQLKIFSGAGHLDLQQMADREYEQVILDFLGPRD